MTETVQLLQQYGGWATTAFLALAMGKLYKDLSKTIEGKDDLINELNKNHHQEMVAVVRECTGVLTTVNDSMERIDKYLNRRGSDNG